MRFGYFLLVLLSLEMRAWAADLVVYQPVRGSGDYLLTFSIKNSDEGAIYHTGSLKILQELYEAGLNPYANILPPPSGDAFTGWSADVDLNGVVQLTNNGQVIFGSPAYTVWDTETMTLGLAVSTAGLEQNGLPGHQMFSLADVLHSSWDPSLYDTIIVRSDDPLLSAPNYSQAKPEALLDEAFVGVSQDEFSIWEASGYTYLVLPASDFAVWTDFASAHPGLDSEGDDNENGRSNFLDYASGQDPAASGLLPLLEVTDTTLILRRRINGSDTSATVQYSDDLSAWHSLEEGVHYEVVSDTIIGSMRTLVLELLPTVSSSRFFRQGFGP